MEKNKRLTKWKLLYVWKIIREMQLFAGLLLSCSILEEKKALTVVQIHLKNFWMPFGHEEIFAVKKRWETLNPVIFKISKTKHMLHIYFLETRLQNCSTMKNSNYFLTSFWSSEKILLTFFNNLFESTCKSISGSP